MGWLGWVLVLASWVGLVWAKKNGPMSIFVSETIGLRHDVCSNRPHLALLALPSRNTRDDIGSEMERHT